MLLQVKIPPEKGKAGAAAALQSAASSIPNTPAPLPTHLIQVSVGAVWLASTSACSTTSSPDGRNMYSTASMKHCIQPGWIHYLYTSSTPSMKQYIWPWRTQIYTNLHKSQYMQHAAVHPALRCTEHASCSLAWMYPRFCRDTSSVPRSCICQHGDTYWMVLFILSGMLAAPGNVPVAWVALRKRLAQHPACYPCRCPLLRGTFERGWRLSQQRSYELQSLPLLPLLPHQVPPPNYSCGADMLQ
jgi:hypothetical protein